MYLKEEAVKKLQIQIISIITLILAGITVFSIANATTPEENKAQGTAFLAENTKKPNIKTTPSGLQYEIITAGNGAKSPTATDNVTVHYKGTTLDGSEFDSSYSRGEPATFPLNRVIPGWTEGVQLMTEGAKYRFYIPSELAYGERGAGPIPPNAALIFDVELIKIQ
jgi:FKBP-type peptidyl-prolyl cis-trans isomerase